VDNVAIDEEGQVTLLRLVGLSLGLGLVIAWISFRSFSVVLVITFVGMVSAQASLAFVGWTGHLLDAILMSMPSLVYVLGLSGAVHIINYYRDTVIESGFPGDPEEAVRQGFSPCFLAAFTTAIGLVSLTASDIIPIRKFGIFSALGVMFTLTLMFSFLPSVLSLWPPRSFALEAEKRRAHPHSDWATRLWIRFAQLIVRHHYAFVIGCTVLMIVLGYAIREINTSVQLLKLFDPRHKLIQDYAWVESNLGKLVPMELVVRVPESEMRVREFDDDAQSAERERFELSFLERMEITEHIRRTVEEYFGEEASGVTGKAMLASTFVPLLPEPGGSVTQAAARSAFSRRLADRREDLVASDFFQIDQERNELWRISLRLGALNDVDYGTFVSSLKAAVEPVVGAYHYRKKILKLVDDSRKGKDFRSANVLLLGDPQQLAKASQQPPSASKPAQGPNPQPSAASVNQDAIFLRTLAALLANASVRSKALSDPASVEPEKLDEYVRQFDAVVVATSDPKVLEIVSRDGFPPNLSTADFRFDPKQDLITARTKDWPISVAYTGLVPVIYKAQRTLLRSLINSTFWAFVAISVVMMIVLRNFMAGIISMIPNVFPIVIVFGYMGWQGILVDIGTMMTASIAMGIAVDGTLHFLTWFRRALDRGLEQTEAIIDAYSRCASAMTQTTLIAGIGLSVFGFSTFTPTQRFGILMVTLLFSALFGDLVLLPALLAGPFGRIFKSPKPQDLGVAREDSASKTAKPEAMRTVAFTETTSVLSPHDQFLRNLDRNRQRIWGKSEPKGKP
jgi:predicted RND superfamily exporter protein